MSEAETKTEQPIDNMAEEINDEITRDEENKATNTVNDTETEGSNDLSSEETGEAEEESLDDLDINDLPLPEIEPKSKKDYIILRKEKQLERERAEKIALQRQLESNYQQNQPQHNNIQKNAPLTPPNRDQFATEDDYIDARMEYKLALAGQKMREHQMQQAAVAKQQATVKKYESVLEKGSQKYDDFDEVIKPILDPYGDFPPNPMMGEAITESPYGEDIFYFLAKYPKQAREIALLPPVQAVKKIAELELRFKQKKGKQASPKPNNKIIEPMTGSTGGKSTRRLEDMSKEELDRMSPQEFATLWKERSKTKSHKHF